MRKTLSRSFSIAILSATTMASSVSHANFASDPTRKDSASFTRFFLKRFDKWFVENVGDPRVGLDKKETAFVDEFLLTVPTFGQNTPTGFVRFLRYGVTIDGEKVSAGPHRFVLSDSQAQMKTKILEIAKAKSITLDKTSEASLVGLGFTGARGELELVFKDEAGSLVPDAVRKSLTKKPVWVTRLYRAGKLISSEALEVDIESGDPCVGSRTISQIDRVIFESGQSLLSCHISLFEDRALVPAARAIAVKIRRGFNLYPGVLEVSGKRVRMFYP